MTLLAAVPDPRDPRGLRHPLPVLLVLGLAAVLAGARSFVVIGEWVAHQPAQVLAGLGVLGPGPAESTIRRAFVRVDADALDQAIGAFIWTRTKVVGARRVIALDGKTVCGARGTRTDAPHLVAAFDHDDGTRARTGRDRGEAATRSHGRPRRNLCCRPGRRGVEPGSLLSWKLLTDYVWIRPSQGTSSQVRGTFQISDTRCNGTS